MITRLWTTRRQKRLAAAEAWIPPAMVTGKKQDAVSIFKDNVANFSASYVNQKRLNG